MTNADRPWEPPFAGTEAEQLLGALNRLRATFRWKTAGLDEAGLGARLAPSALTLGGLLKHLAFNEDHASTVRLTGESIGEPWTSCAWGGDEEWMFTSAADDTAGELYAMWDGAVTRSRARFGTALATGGLDQRVHLGSPDLHVSLRRLLCDLIEEYGRHTGHADLIRESVDGLVGEDPPSGWHT